MPRKSPVLGIVAVILVVACGVICPLCTYSFHEICFQETGWDFNVWVCLERMESTSVYAISLAWAIGAIGSGLVGLVAFVLSIVAIATKRGRLFGIIGGILGLFAPVGILVAIVELLLSHVSTPAEF